MRTVYVQCGEKYLPDIRLPELSAMCRKEPPGQSREILLAAFRRKQGDSEDYIARLLARSHGTISRWLRGLEKKGFKFLKRRKIPGRPHILSKKQEIEIANDLKKEPTKLGYERGSWDSRLVAIYIKNKFGITCSRSSILVWIRRWGFSIRKSRPVHHKTATSEENTKYLERLTDAIYERVPAGYTVFAMDAAAVTNSPSNYPAIRQKGWRDNISINFSRKSRKILGAIDEHGKSVLHFCDKANSDNVMVLFEKVRKKYGKAVFILDNAGAHKSKKIKKYLKETKGDIILVYIPPYTPQNNPIEKLWDVIKRAISARYYKGGFDEMEKSIRKMIKTGEIIIPRLFGYIIDTIVGAKLKPLFAC